MNTEENKTSNTAEIIKAAAELSKAVPIYQDGLQSGVKEIGKSLETLGKAVNIALLPVTGLIWGADKFKDFLENDLTQKLKNIPEENICSPDPSIAGPALEALKFSGHKEQLKEMYANLLAKSLNKDTTDLTHPSYVEIIKQLTVEEAQLLQLLSEKEKYPIICSFINISNNTGLSISLRNKFNKLCLEINISKENSNTYYDNLQRLKIIEISEIRNQKVQEDFLSKMDLHIPGNDRFEVKTTTTYILKFTSYGDRFVKICIK